MSTQPTENHTTVIEKSSGGTIMLALVLFLAVICGLFIYNQHGSSEVSKNNAIERAADQVNNTAKKAGDAVDDTAK